MVLIGGTKITVADTVVKKLVNCCRARSARSIWVGEQLGVVH